MQKIRILHVVQAAGGVDRYIRMLLKYLDKEEFENIMVCSQDFHKGDYKGLADCFEQIEMNRAIGMSDLKSIREVRKQIKKYNPDIIYAHSSKAGAIARMADIGLKNRCVYNPHGWAFNMRCSEKKKMMYAVIEKIAAPFCDKIICISDAEKQSALHKKICKEEKLQVIFNGVDIKAYENGTHGKVKRADLNIPEDAFVVGMVGRISPQKAPDVFVRMAKLVKDEVPNAHFVIVGSGNQEAEVRQYAEDNGFEDSLHITGWVNDPMSYVELFDIACLLSRSEILFAVIVYRTISNELYQSQAVWRLCESLIAVQIPLDWKLIPLLNSLTKCQEETQIQKTDTEKQAIYKLQCRMIGCRIARELYRRNIQANIIGTWKLVSECKDEFTEIRNIRFDENS